MKRQTIKELRNFARRRVIYRRRKSPTRSHYSGVVEKDALVRAAIDGMNLEKAKALVKAGADVNAENWDNNTALYFAVTHCSPDVVKFLISEGADVNHQAKDGKTPLFPATSSFFGKPENAMLLLDAGADPYITNKDGRNVLTAGCNPNIALMLLKNGVDVNTQDGNGKTLLHDASGRPWEEGNFPEVLIEMGANVNVRTKWGTTPIFFTIHDNLLDNAWVLLDNGADINAQNDKGETPLIRAVKCGQLSFVRLFLECGADTSLRSKEGTALEIAEAEGHTRIAALLRTFGRDTDKRRHFQR